jgi:hypothetical protein
MKDTRKYTAFADIFDGIRQHARSIHTALKRGWNCDCETPHIVALRLENVPRVVGPQTSMWLLTSQGQKLFLKFANK